MLVYPAVDIAGGRCVRLLQGKPEDETVYYEDPRRAAEQWQALGASALHVVDLDGALGREWRPDAEADANAAAVAAILQQAQVPVQVAGGLRSERAVGLVLRMGATRAVVGTRAAREPDWAVRMCTAMPGRIVVALDAREGRVAVEGWRELTDVSPVELALRLAEGPPAAFLYTDVARDGMMSRPNFEGVQRLLEATEVPVIASGGVSCAEDIERLGECGADAVIVGKALYEGALDLSEALETAAQFPSRLQPAPIETQTNQESQSTGGD
ncbi:MAG: 1-(5-phosphoribosyl)-5-[(5-phosphoribosylamino)methylideneamino]imidazole-4-carboxamide isomerase [Candidatus Brocadiia bacterium]